MISKEFIWNILFISIILGNLPKHSCLYIFVVFFLFSVDFLANFFRYFKYKNKWKSNKLSQIPWFMGKIPKKEN
jgi:hypothetical protein